VNCGPRHIQCSNSSAYSDFNIQVNVSTLLLEKSRQFNESCTEIWVLNTLHTRQFTQCVLWCRPDIYNVFTASLIQATIFNWTYLRCNWRYLDNSLLVNLQTWCPIQRTSSSLRYVICGPGHIQCNYSTAYSGFNIQQNVAPLLLEICRQFTDVLQTWSQYSV
jgi:hypothetical protein